MRAQPCWLSSRAAPQAPPQRTREGAGLAAADASAWVGAPHGAPFGSLADSASKPQRKAGAVPGVETARNLGLRTLLTACIQSHRTQCSFESPESVGTVEEKHLQPHTPQVCLTRDPFLSRSQGHVPDQTERKPKPVSPFQEGRCVSCPQPSPMEARK